MKSLVLRRYPLSAVALAVLVACGGSQSPMGGSAAMPQTSAIAAARLGFRSMPSPIYEVQYSFGKGSDGSNPAAAIVGVSNGSGCCVYGTTQYGGKYNKGTAFSFGSRVETVLHSFGDGSDGAYPIAGLIGVNGILYGTTPFGGKSGDGTVFSINPKTGTEKVLFDFNGHDGTYPYSRLLNVDGTLYGTTYEGGAGNRGTVYSVTTSGTQKVLYSFTGRTRGGSSDGASPIADLISVDGTLYGTTDQGGKSGVGTLFSLNPTTSAKTTLHEFSGSDGVNPWARLLNVKGTLYGTTQGGGTKGDGTIFTLVPPAKGRASAFSVLHNFTGSDGGRPRAGLTDFDDELYGTTSYGGASDRGTVYNISLKGALGLAHSFAGGSDGADPWADVLLEDNVLYGTTRKGGQYHKGIIFLCDNC
jgi:uncharacterized repeat protein (TIGR03803 family)